jgi:hypothetical protein
MGVELDRNDAGVRPRPVRHGVEDSTPGMDGPKQALSNLLGKIVSGDTPEDMPLQLVS